MVDYRTEEEQIELLKKWWRENGRATVVGVVVALLFFLGMNQWRSHQQARIESAADLFQQMTIAGDSSDGVQKVTALAEQLRKEYPNTVYGIFAALRLAKESVAANDFPAAANFLDWAQSQNPDASLVPLIGLRLAQVQFAQGEYDNALSTLMKLKVGDVWQGSILELRGDIQQAQGKSSEARDSYNAALKAFEAAGDQEHRTDLEIKVSNVSAAVQGNNP